MARPDFPLTILEFQQRFGTEEACREYLFASRWPDGFVCPACGGRDAGAQTRRHLWVCTACGRQTSITAGTVASYCTSRSKGFGWFREMDGVRDPLAACLLDVGTEGDV